MNAATPLSEPRNQKLGGGCLLLFGLIFFVMGSVFFWIFFLHPLIRTVQAKSWQSTDAVVTSSSLKDFDSDDGRTWKPVIHFTYSVNGVKKESTTWSFIDVSSNHGWADGICNKYPPGSKQTCYYDPDNTDDAVLDRTFEQVSWLSLFTLIFVVVGAAVMGAGIQTWRSKGQKKPGSAIPMSANKSRILSEHDSDVPWAGHDGPQRLMPAISRIWAVVGAAFIAIFWNSISWTLFIISIRENGFLSITSLFMVVFVLIGAGLICLFIYVFLGLFNPVISIALSNGAVAPGETVDVAWETEGNTRRISELTIDLVGIEKATYTRGTDTVTDTHEFVRIPVTKTSDTEAIRFGSVAIQVPLNSMHTFAAQKNKIEWTIAVNGVIPMWPDIKDSFVFFVKSCNQPDAP